MGNCGHEVTAKICMNAQRLPSKGQLMLSRAAVVFVILLR
jgi:hypothetical protein